MPDFTTVGVVDASSSWIIVSFNGDQEQTGVSSSSTINFIDGGGADGVAGLIAITNLEIYGSGSVSIDGHTVTAPTVFAADPMGGRKTGPGSITIANSSISTLNFGTVDSAFQTIGAGPESGSTVTGWIDYYSSEIVIQGEVVGTEPNTNEPVTIEFSVTYDFQAPPRPELYIARTEYQGYINFDASGSSAPQGQSIVDWVWYVGNQPLTNGYLDPQMVLGYGSSINIQSASMGQESVVTLYAITDQGNSAVATRCYWTSSLVDCYPAQ